ncbi:MAG TPA: bacillithiol system redox-active protein YtxJ [Bacilli bacterium]
MKKWREITTIDEWEEVLAHSEERPAVVLKHSTRCEISAGAFKEYERYLSDHPREDVDYLLVKVIQSRPVSNKIAEDLQIKHESPQAILIDRQKAVWNASHRKVTAAHLQEALQ